MAYDASQLCGRGQLDLVVGIYVCDFQDYEREETADELTEAVLLRLNTLRGDGVSRVASYSVRTERDSDRIGMGFMLRQITLRLDVNVDHSRPLCDPVPACKPRFEFVEPEKQDCAPRDPDE